LNDPALTAAVVVTLPEMLPVTECLELIEGLGESGMPVGPIIVNKLPPGDFDAAESAALEAALEGKRVFGADRFRRVSHSQKSLQRLEQVDIPVLSLPEYPLEGAELIEALSEYLYAFQEET
jgi:anion-transporting  ArsA/GET3 family ATPase